MVDHRGDLVVRTDGEKRRVELLVLADVDSDRPVLELQLPTLLVLNMSDELDERGGRVDDVALAERLGVEVVRTSARTGAGVEAVREYLAAARTYLTHLHRSGASGQAVNEANSDLIDRLVRHLFEGAEAEYYRSHGDVGKRLSIVAVGGYGRREMSIHSDVDLLFLHRGKLSSAEAWIAERVQYGMWDSRLQMGGATRTIAQTIALARKDLTVRTAVLDARFLAGSSALFHEFWDVIRRELIADPCRLGCLDFMRQD